MNSELLTITWLNILWRRQEWNTTPYWTDTGPVSIFCRPFVINIQESWVTRSIFMRLLFASSFKKITLVILRVSKPQVSEQKLVFNQAKTLWARYLAEMNLSKIQAPELTDFIYFFLWSNVMEVSEPCEKIFAYLVWSLGLWIWLSTLVAGRLNIPYHNIQLFIIYLFIYSFIYLLFIIHYLFIYCYTDPAWLSLTNERKFVD